MPGDPIATFDITVPANQRSAELDGWEFNVQHVFGDCGFGVAANYTIVDSRPELRQLQIAATSSRWWA